MRLVPGVGRDRRRGTGSEQSDEHQVAHAGSVATADRLVRTMISLAGVSLRDAVKMMTATPARIAGLAGKKGELTAGMDADIVVFDDDITVSTTIVNGNIVYTRP